MEGFVKGDVVVLPFPFSDISATKRRPALILASGEYGDCILCQITSKSKSVEAVEIKRNDFQEGGLKITSYARPRKIFTADFALILYRAGHVKKEKMKESEDVICRIMKE